MCSCKLVHLCVNVRHPIRRAVSSPRRPSLKSFRTSSRSRLRCRSSERSLRMRSRSTSGNACSLKVMYMSGMASARHGLLYRLRSSSFLYKSGPYSSKGSSSSDRLSRRPPLSTRSRIMSSRLFMVKDCYDNNIGGIRKEAVVSRCAVLCCAVLCCAAGAAISTGRNEK